MRVFGPRFSLSVLLPMLIVPITIGAQSISDTVSAPVSVIVGPFVNLTHGRSQCDWWIFLMYQFANRVPKLTKSAILNIYYI